MKLETLEAGALGEWWLPEYPSQRVSGTIIWTSLEGAHLQLLDSITTDPFVNHSSNSEQTIFGDIDGVPLTLHNATSVSVSLKSSKLTARISESFRASRLFIGHHVTPSDIGAIREYQLTSPTYSAWQNQSGITVQAPPVGTGFSQGFSITALQISDRNFVVNDNVELDLRHQVSLHRDIFGNARLAEVTKFCFLGKPNGHLDFFREQSSRLRDLLSLATGRQVETPETQLIFQQPQVESDFANLIQLLEAGSDLFDPKPLKSPESFAFRLGEGFESDDFSKWLNMGDRIRSHVRRLLATRHSQGMYLEDKLHNVAAVLQGMGRDLAENPREDMQPSLEKVFHFVDEDLRLGVPDVSKWKKALADRRNEISHHDANVSNLEFNTSLSLYYSSYWLAMFACFKFLDLTPTFSRKVATSGWAQHETAFAKAYLGRLI